jgi:redox-sensitive bicupin YhaK (pirin superfamily)
MITVRKASDRGHADHGWLDSHHTFSFADYYDSAHMGFRALRVLNDDRVTGGKGFGSHPHRDMEIISYVLDGALAHRDSTGTGAVIHAGDVQRMTAGTGVVHSEFNASPTDPVHFLQIWLLPSRHGLVPGYEQKTFSDDDKRGRLRVVASPDGRDDSITIRTLGNTVMYAGLFDDGQDAEIVLESGRSAWVHVARGRVVVGDSEVAEGDGLAIADEPVVRVAGAAGGGEVLVFDLA